MSFYLTCGVLRLNQNMWELRNVLWKVGMVLKVAHVNSGSFWIILRDDMNFKIIETDDQISCKSIKTYRI